MDLVAISDAIRPYWVVWLMILFGVVLFWAFRPKNKRRFEEDAQIPLKDDD
ncbi:MAG: cbb3-type cytochrome c oxidase subunit 3 [Rhodospirillales bacterium]|nr:cbb3-type cytochrome c oxidase subunit 3 [Rhodospirillales bacterium]MCW8862306.1 cbb3-type cytochrome c oxidase subunit 3 [Rhodospirillales bacterium]MCW8952844.1 cbb3-type cytochrome c oxidase subunit 3 [Rhodospirillales bacterium]MCW8970199.1 cbb3-type cytochrome c oxidase subunit 3 [Rhodospirillales bacterium]MCW9001136.1 cbb3-type cytochrome c oxidase subunit 3 [Rhodospirillales bacterium]